MKEELAPLVSELLGLKETYKKVTGEDYGGVKKEETKTKNVDFKNIDLNQLSPNVLENYENYHLYIFIYFI